ncbi:hypothetical protein MKZ38_008285 [Zalerion maritima]|uniref:Beta-apo-4'-carotenal oxygenase n=1 Tax=Zalerion maritima TaxID=339359 RepID=A0AAD5WMU2_9PEZI|nr:hypothetical protein MKZ38_008285 [Zalerion maritima]
MAVPTDSQRNHFTTKEDFDELYQAVRNTFATGKTKSLAWRKWQLKQFWWMIVDNEEAITAALHQDLGRHEIETLSSEIRGLKDDVLEHIDHLEQWAADEPVAGAGLIFGTLGKARIRKEPLGVVLVIGPWNFPFLLTLQPVLAAIAAGCCVVVKPSELAVASERLMARLVAEYMDSSAIRLVTGGPEETSRVLGYKFNQIFFTGSSKVAKFVALAAAKHLTPTVLELGGQAPAIVTTTADLDLTAKRVAYAKFFNAGQICLSVNHVYVDPAVHDEFVQALKKWTLAFSGAEQGGKEASRNTMCKIISRRNYERLTNLLSKSKGNIICGGGGSRDKRVLSGTVVAGVDLNDSLMSEELFGPICPVIKADYKEAVRMTNSLPHPLAVYIFSTNPTEIEESKLAPVASNRIEQRVDLLTLGLVERNTISGGVTINDVILHASVPGAPFGGVGDSGMGYYHGKYGFLAFTHTRIIVSPPMWLDRVMSFRYPPFDLGSRGKLVVKDRVGIKKGETMADQKIKTWPPGKKAAWVKTAIVLLGIVATYSCWEGGAQLSKALSYLREGRIWVVWYLNYNINIDSFPLICDASPPNVLRSPCGELICIQYNDLQRRSASGIVLVGLGLVWRISRFLNSRALNNNVDAKFDWDKEIALVANAGICRGKAILQASERDIELMVAGNHGHFLVVASQTGYVATPGLTDYSASKAAAIAIYEGLRAEMRHHYGAPAVRVSRVPPGAPWTPRCSRGQSWGGGGHDGGADGGEPGRPPSRASCTAAARSTHPGAGLAPRRHAGSVRGNVFRLESRITPWPTPQNPWVTHGSPWVPIVPAYKEHPCVADLPEEPTGDGAEYRARDAGGRGVPADLKGILRVQDTNLLRPHHGGGIVEHAEEENTHDDDGESPNIRKNLATEDGVLQGRICSRLSALQAETSSARDPKNHHLLYAFYAAFRARGHFLASIVRIQSAQVLVNASGILNAWRYPAIPGIDSFRGTLVHSAAWPENLDLEGKVVGLIGNGSSGIQILPAVKKQAKKLVTFIREATWIAPPLGDTYQPYSEEDKRRFAEDGAYHIETRKKSEDRANGAFGIFHSGSEDQAHTRAYMEETMRTKLQNPGLEKVLIPGWAVGCRRLTPGTSYLESLNDENVSVVFGEITHITQTGVICGNGKGEHHVDVLICATGFDTTFKPRFPLVGSSGDALATVWKGTSTLYLLPLARRWAALHLLDLGFSALNATSRVDEPKGYLGVAVDKFPNYFFTLGPNCPIGNGPVLIAIEAEVDYIISMLSKFQKENIRSFDVKTEAVRDFNDWKDSFMEETIWSEPCRSWYKIGSASGKILALWPGSTLHYLDAIREPRWEDWEFRYESENRFAYLGNGHSSAEALGLDLSSYIRGSDDSPIDPILKRGDQREKEVPTAKTGGT